MERTGRLTRSSASTDNATSSATSNKTGRDVRGSVATRNFTNTQTDEKSATEKANLAFRVSFSIPLNGRYPLGGTTSC